jgi:hypothetical protein
MSIDEGSITYCVPYFVPEILCDSNNIDNRFRSFNESFLRTGLPPNSGEPYEFENIGGFDGPWTFWNKLRSYETHGNFTFQPRFGALDLALELDSNLQSRYDIVDAKITPRLLYYPFGLFVVRLRVYISLATSVASSTFVRLQNELFDAIDVWRRNSRSDTYLDWHSSGEHISRSILKQIVTTLFEIPLPDRHWGRLGDLYPYPITYLYGSHDLSLEEKFALTSQETREYNHDTMRAVVQPELGQFEGDEIIVDSSGSLVHTPYLDSIRPDSRRWKRLQVLNNLYLGSDLARFEKYHFGQISAELDKNLDEYVHGTLYGVPISTKLLVVLRELLDFGDGLKTLRGDVYTQLRPEQKDHYYQQVQNTTDRATEHESELRKLLRVILPTS